jgi:hypothetical protein
VMVDVTQSNSQRLVIHSTAAISVINGAALVGKEMTCRVREITFISRTMSGDKLRAGEVSPKQHSEISISYFEYSYLVGEGSS